MIVNAAPNGQGGVDALVEMKLAAIEAASVRLGSAAGPALTFLDLPYVLEPLIHACRPARSTASASVAAKLPGAAGYTSIQVCMPSFASGRRFSWLTTPNC